MRPTLKLLLAFFLASAPLGAKAESPEELARFIDERLEKTWRAQRLTPSKPCLDSEYLRRVYLDIVGVIPSEQTVRAFLSNPDSNKRWIVVDQLLESNVSARYASVVWGNLLVGRGTGVEALTQKRFRDWLYRQFKSNARFDQTTRAILTASGTAAENPAVIWTLHHDSKAENLTGAAAKVFLGTQIQCAQCHDHPFADWSQEDFYGMAAFFAGTSERLTLGGNRVRESTASGIRLGGEPSGKLVRPKFLGGVAPPVAGSSPGRQQLADWIINKQFARTVANRLWARMLGRGLVDPADDFGPANPAVYPQVLERLADGFAAADFDLKFLVRTIARTRAYQLSSRPSRNNKDDQQYFSKARLRRLGPEQLVASIVMSTGLGDKAETWENPLFQFLMQAVQKDFVFVFANPDETQEVSEFRGTIGQALMMMNSKHMASATDFKLLSPLTAKLLKCRTVSEKIQLLFLSTVSRPPSAAELRHFGQHFRGVGRVRDQLEICEDLYWALLNSNEFAFNH
jgi:hypothetical protein